MTFLVYTLDSKGVHLLPPGVKYTPPRTEGKLTLFDCFVDYTRDQIGIEGGDAQRAWICFRAWGEALGWDKDCNTLTREDGRTVLYRELTRVKAATARKHLTIGIAALNHAKKEKRITIELPKFQMPKPAQARQRALTREEHRQLMLVPKPFVRQLFWLLAFGTGARTSAIFELEWSRIDFARRTIDYRIPGVNHKNKRRAVVPIHDGLFPRLQAAYERRDRSSPFVFMRKGKRYSKGANYHECVADLLAIGIDEEGVARHVARHTVVTWMLQGDPARGIPPAPIQKVAQFVGDTVAMIEKTYSHVLPTDLHDAARLLH